MNVFTGTASDAANYMADKIRDALSALPDPNILLGARVTVQGNGTVMVENTLPDPNITGPCNLQASPFCTNAGVQRMDPVDMLSPATAFRDFVMACPVCYDARADKFVAKVHGR